ncbi:hypothetical protein RDABS01_031569 [Bienertia sinuspersici]
MPSPIFTKKLKETPETKENEEQTDVEIEKTSETEDTKQQEEGFIKENPSPSLFSEEKEDPDKIDETEKIRVNLQEASYKNSSTSYSGNRYNSETEKDNSDDKDDELLKIIKEENKNLFWFEKHPLVIPRGVYSCLGCQTGAIAVSTVLTSAVLTPFEELGVSSF